MYHQVPNSAVRLMDQQSLQQRDYSNHVLVSHDGAVYFLPAYLRIIFLEVEDINIEELTATLYATLVLNIYYQNLPEDFLDDLQEMVIFQGTGDSKNCMIRNNIDLHTMEYIYRGKLPLRLQCDVFMAPFELIDCKLLMNFYPIIVFRDSKLQILKLNLMDVDDNQIKCSLLYMDSNVHGQYALAESSLELDYSAVRQVHFKKFNLQNPNVQEIQMLQQRIMQQRETYKVPSGLIYRQRIYNWRFVVYKFKMYRYPINTIVILFVPLYILTFVNLVVFWGDPEDVSGKLQTISGLMIAYGALVPEVRQRIPPSPKITVLQLLLYTLSFTIFLSTLQTLVAVVQSEDHKYTFVWNKNWRFLLSVALSILTFVVIIVLSIIHKCLWEPRYNYRPDSVSGMQYEDYKIDTAIWYNNVASTYLKDKTRIVQASTYKHDISHIVKRNVQQPKQWHEFPGDAVSTLKKQQPELFKYRQGRKQRNSGSMGVRNNQKGLSEEEEHKLDLGRSERKQENGYLSRR